MKPGLDDLGDAAVDDRARVDDDVRVADAASPPRRPVGRPDEPDRLRGDEQVLALGHGQPEHPEAEEQRDRRAAARSRTAAGSCDSGKPSSRPISRPSSRPTMAVTNSAVDSSSTWRDEPARPARPSGTAGSRSRRRSRPRPRPRAAPRRRPESPNSPPSGRRRGRARRGRRARPRGDGYCGSTASSGLPRSRPGAGGWRGGQPSIAGDGLAMSRLARRRAPPRPRRGASRPRSDRRPGDVGARRTAPGRGHDRPA